VSAGALPGFAPPPRADAGERWGLVLAVALHAVLLVALSLSWGAPTPPPAFPKPEPIEVSLVKDVAPTATAPPAPTPPAPSVAPDQGEPEDAAPPPPAPTLKPEPVKPAPPPPAPKPAPEPKPQPKSKPVEKPAPAPVEKPKPEKSAKAEAPATPAKPAPAKAAAPRPSRLAGLGQELAAGAKADAAASHARGHRLGADILAGLSADAPAKQASAAAPAAKAGPFPTASIQQAIQRQIQPCADRQVDPGPGANQIVTTLNIRLNQDGTLAATPRMVRQTGLSDSNDRYAQRVTDLGIAAFKGCTPLHLPAEYYQTANGGWSNINYRWQLK
jgi:outer membrane biosynthesis protein TonB